MADYHYIHCTKCGRKMKANEVAFDFGKILNIQLEKYKNKRFGATSDWYDLVKFNLSLYLTLDDLINEYDFEKTDNTERRYKGVFNFTVEKLENHILKLSGDKNATIADIAKEKGAHYEYLTKYLSLSKDADIEELADNIQSLANKISKEPDKNKTIVSFEVDVILKEDDQGLMFANSLQITFGINDKYYESLTVCKGENNPCGNILYDHAGKYEEIIISLVGTARVGKTAYLASLLACIMRLKHDYGFQLGYEQNIIQHIAHSDSQFKVFKDIILDKYLGCEAIDKTAVQSQDIPLFSLTFEVKKKKYIFTFVDMPGEVYDTNILDSDSGANFILNQRPILKHAKMIWFCMSPDQIAGNKLMAGKNVNLDMAKILSNITRVIDVYDPNREIPTAVLITKSDVITNDGVDLYKPDFNVFKEWIVNDEINSNKMFIFSKKCEKYINHMHLNFSTSIHNTFGDFTPFAVASYGCNIDDTKGNHVLQPSMIEAPFLWTLSVLQILDAKKEVKIIEKKLFRKVEKIELVPVSIDELLFCKG